MRTAASSTRNCRGRHDAKALRPKTFYNNNNIYQIVLLLRKIHAPSESEFVYWFLSTIFGTAPCTLPVRGSPTSMHWGWRREFCARGRPHGRLCRTKKCDFSPRRPRVCRAARRPSPREAVALSDRAEDVVAVRELDLRRVFDAVLRTA